ncbi:hypothetical protein [Kribbella endophytica]
MLRLRIRVGDLGSSWRQDHRGVWRSGSSFIEPLAHSALETSGSVRPGTLRLVVRPNIPPEDELTVEIDSTSATLRAGSGGVAPVYLAVHDGVLHGSWEPADLRSVSENDLLDRAVTRLLARRHRYSSDTLFVAIRRLTERALASFNQDGLALIYPSDAEHILEARQLRRSCDPVEVIDQLLEEQIAPILTRHRAGLELSGGVDSANVAVAANGCTLEQLSAYGLVTAGPGESAQRFRRASLIRRLGLKDASAATSEHLPFCDRGPRSVSRPHYADGDVYREAFDELRRLAAQQGTAVMLTGFGGDEAMSLRTNERTTPRRLPSVPSWLGDRARDAMADLETNVAPAAATAVPCLMAFAARGPAYLHSGLWPVAPLAAPQVLRFSESLPLHWRKDKRLLRERLKRRGFDEAVTVPQIPESFDETMQLALRKNGLAMVRAMLAKSILIDEGFVHRGELERELRWSVGADRISPLLYDTLAVERSLQSMDGCREEFRRGRQ